MTQKQYEKEIGIGNGLKRTWQTITQRLLKSDQVSFATVRGNGDRDLTRRELADLLESHATEQSPHRIEELVKIFIQATKVWFNPQCDTKMMLISSAQMETGFWDMGSGGLS